MAAAADQEKFANILTMAFCRTGTAIHEFDEFQSIYDQLYSQAVWTEIQISLKVKELPSMDFIGAFSCLPGAQL